MQECASKSIEYLLQPLQTRGIAPERLTEGLGVDLAGLSGGRHDWDLHVRLLDRYAELVGGLDELQDAGFAVLDAEQMGPVRALAGYMVGLRQLYWMAAHWVGPTYFTHIRYGVEDLPGGQLRFTIEIPESHRPSLPYFWITKGSLRRAPHLLGISELAQVDMQVEGGLAVYSIQPPRSRSLWGAVSRVLGFRTAATRAVEVLAEQQRDLNRRTEELQRAEERLGEQLGHLETLDLLGRRLAAQIESEHLGDALLQALRERFGWRGAALWVGSPGGGEMRLASAAGGVEGSPEAHTLAAGGRTVGRLDVWGLDRPEDPVRQELFGKVLPWIAVAVANAHGEREADAESFRWAGGERDSELFLIVDAAGRVRYAGPTVDRILGIEQDAALDVGIQDLVHPEDLPGLQERFTSFGEGPGSATFSSSRLLHSDGSWRVLEGVGIKVQDENRRPVFMFSGSDITDRQRPH